MAALQEESSDRTIDFGGSRTVRTVEQSHSLLLEALHSSSSIRVDCSPTREADLSLIQLLLAARKTAASFGKRLTLAHPVQGALHDVLVRGGFLKADSPAEERAFWLKSEALDENRT
ncbi:MAG: STAS domain-containing protein [Rhodomicrobium sp.]